MILCLKELARHHSYQKNIDHYFPKRNQIKQKWANEQKIINSFYEVHYENHNSDIRLNSKMKYIGPAYLNFIQLRTNKIEKLSSSSARNGRYRQRRQPDKYTQNNLLHLLHVSKV